MLDWLDGVKSDLEKNLLSSQDYTLFMLTLYLGDRKSETYALQWKHIDFPNHTIHLKKSLDKRQNQKATKSGKDTLIQVSETVMDLLQEWNELQKIELQKLKITQTSEQFLFTYSKPSGEVNCPVHIDYLNYRINTLRRRHKHLEHLTPHKLPHTFATLAKQGGADISKISEALTHSEVATTKIYVNTPNVVNLDIYEAFDCVLQKSQSE